MPYKIVSSDKGDLLTEKVEALEKEGWKATGGVSVVTVRIQVGFDQGGDREFADIIGFHQAMTRAQTPKATSRTRPLLKPSKVVELYNHFFKGKKVSLKLKPTSKLETRLRICIEKEFKSAPEWIKYFELIAMSDFLMGDVSPQNGYKQFKLSLDFIVNETNIAKILEGNFNNG